MYVEIDNFQYKDIYSLLSKFGVCDQDANALNAFKQLDYGLEISIAR